MPRILTFHRSNSWPQVVNHLDGRQCPTCKATVHGPEAQADHYQHHLDIAELQDRVNELIEMLNDRANQLANVLRVQFIEEPSTEPPAADWKYATQIVGGTYIPAGEPVE